MKRGLLLIGITFAVTLAVVFGARVSADALAVIIGVLLGVVASIPTTVLVVFVLTRQRQGADRGLPQTAQQPPVIIVNAPDRTSLPSPPALPAPYSADPTRKWTVVGDMETNS
jgi:hypothetical protein